MNVDVVFLPRDLKPRHLAGRAVVVFDVLRATTTMMAALAAGVSEIRIYGDLVAAASAARAINGPSLLCGEANCLPPPGFDLGNSPGAFVADRHRGMTALMSTTNGTRAILAARGASTVFVGAIVNAAAVTAALIETGLDVTLLCAGTNGQVAMEDVIGAGAVLDAMADASPDCRAAGDNATIAKWQFRLAADDLHAALADADGGRNVISAGFAEDVAFAARLNVLSAVGVVTGDVPTVRLFKTSHMERPGPQISS